MDAAPAPSETPELKLHFLDYWRVIRLRKSLILTVFLLCVISSFILSYCLPKQYSSTVIMEVQKDQYEVALSGPNQAPGWDPYWLTTQFRLITGWDILTPVISNLNLTHVLPSQLKDQDWTIDKTYNTLAHRTSVDQTRGTSLIEISVRNPDAEVAAAIANKIADTYKQYRADFFSQNKTAGLESFARDLETNRILLSNMMADLDKMRIEYDISELDDANPQANATIYSEQIRLLESRRIEAEVEFNDHNGTLSNLIKLGTNLPEAIATVKGQVDPDLYTLHERVELARDALTEAGEKGYGPDHPNFISAQNVFKQAQRAYLAKVDGIMAGWVAVVDHDKSLLDYITDQESQAKKESQQEARKDRVYWN